MKDTKPEDLLADTLLPTPTAFIYNFASRLRLVRRKQKLTMRDLAVRAGVEPEAGRHRISRIERSEVSVSLYTAFCLAKALEVSIDELCVQITE